MALPTAQVPRNLQMRLSEKLTEDDKCDCPQKRYGDGHHHQGCKRLEGFTSTGFDREALRLVINDMEKHTADPAPWVGVAAVRAWITILKKVKES